ncbi:MAG TPA: protein kinase [Thermoanaerobaculia bacterium]|nr:protein kinase [Thermoanaerobaculia bacterium]
MALSPGEKLGPYEVTARIGAGGMGEVWRARDTRLGRDVAIKILTRTGSSDADRIRRFEVEMKAVGRLSHPNVLAVFDVGSHDDVPYLVSELLEGETLRDRLDRGPLPIKAVATTAVEVAQGLAAAHAAGVIHRDLKPENVFLTRDGRVKLLDFGLAKLVESQGPLTFEGLDEAETAARLTVSGIVVGTVRYMSPEQIRGAQVDHRSDIFAFGALLFEMLTGQMAFRRPSAIESLSATLAEDPLSRLADPSSIPEEIEPILKRCLDKNPDDRFQSAADLSFQLREYAQGFSRTSSARRRPILNARARRTRAAVAAVLALATLGAAGLAWRLGRGSAGPGVPSYRQLTFRRGLVLSARFSPDGKTIVYGASWEGEPFRLQSMRTESPESRPLDLPPGDVLAVSSTGELAISLDRKFIYGFQARGTLARVPLVGGAPRKILTDVEDADFSPDGRELAVSRAVEGRYRLEYPIEKTLHEAEGWISSVRVSPDGERVAFVDHPVAGDDRGSICVVDRKGAKTVLAQGWASALGLAWAPGGREVWFTATEVSPNCGLWAVDLKGNRRLLARSPGRLTLQDVSPSGELLVTEGRLRLGMGFGSQDAPVDSDLSWLDATVVSDISRDGRTILFAEQGAGGGVGTYSVYMRGSDGSASTRLGEGTAGPLSPDGHWAVSIVPSTPPTLVLLPTGAGRAKTLERGPIGSYQAVAFFPDGERLLIAANEEGKPVRLYVQSLEAGGPRAVSGPGLRFAPPSDVISPDGRTAAVTDGEGRVVLFPLDGAAPRLAPGLEPGDVPMRWSLDGQALFVFRFDELPAQIRRVTFDRPGREVVARIKPPDPAGVESIVAAQVTPDGRSWVYSYFQFRNDLHLVTGLK